MATSGSCSTSKYNDKKWVDFNWERSSYTNTSTECKSSIYFEIKGDGTDTTTWHWAGPIKVYINKTSGTPDFTFWADRNQLYKDTLVGSGRFDIHHDANGDANFSVYIEAAIYDNSINCYGSGAWALTSLPRNANFTEHYIASTGLNSISVHWDADHTIDWVQYSLNGGAWIDTSGLTYTIYGLSPNTQYNIRTKIRRKSNQVWTESGYIYGTTKDIAKITSYSDLILGNNMSVGYTNPSSANVVIGIYGIDAMTPYAEYRATTQSPYTFNFTDAELDAIYKAMGKSNSLNALLYLRTAGDTYYYDIKSIKITLTGNQKTGHINVNGTYKRTKKWTNVNGIWKRCVRWVNVNGIWKRCI